ncbi:MAG TPA: NAD(+)/NADH kinase [Chloroflexota bacterium]|nr:NAD(+)/NADH kinase [Chloroflexota bacterium]
MRSAAVLLHPKIEQARQVADMVCAALDECTLSVSRASAWDVARLRELLPHVDVAITLGGDGSILRTSRLAALYGTPVLGINLGTLGFLAEMEPAEVPERLPPLVRGNYWVEERIMLQIEHWREGERLATYQALNEAVVGRRSLSRVVRVLTCLNHQELTTYTADGVLVATPTGSTAYSHAAGGPILHPEVHSLILTPICAHPHTSGSIVVPPNTVVALTAHTDHEAALSIDGQEDVPMRDGDVATMSISPHIARFLRNQKRDYFYQTLLRKLRLS